MDLDFSAPALELFERMDAADHIQQDPGDASGEAIPVPIPNTEVKLSSAEDTERAAFRENRSSPGFLRFRERRTSGSRQSPLISNTCSHARTQNAIQT